MFPFIIDAAVPPLHLLSQSQGELNPSMDDDRKNTTTMYLAATSESIHAESGRYYF